MLDHMPDSYGLTGQQRAELDELLRKPIREWIANQGAIVEDVVFLLTRMLPELCDRRHAHGHIEAAYDLYHEHHPELMIDSSAPTLRIDLD